MRSVAAPGGSIFAYPVTTFRAFAYSATMITSGMPRYDGHAGKRRRAQPRSAAARHSGQPVPDGQMATKRRAGGYRGWLYQPKTRWPFASNWAQKSATSRFFSAAR
jgi:hypothetical protein